VNTVVLLLFISRTPWNFLHLSKRYLGTVKWTFNHYK